MTFEAKTGGGTQGATKAADGDVLGAWQLDVRTPFGQYPATLALRRDADGTLDGDIQSQLGNAALSQIGLDGESFEAVVTIRLQGREFSAGVSGRAAAGRMDGTIKVNMPGAPVVKFTGSKAVSGQ